VVFIRAASRAFTVLRCSVAKHHREEPEEARCVSEEAVDPEPASQETDQRDL
jgi:hypothetical protein